jgi:ubiquitin-activating enzyme E1 C
MERWSALNTIYSRASPFGNETGSLPNGEYEPGPGVLENVRSSKVLVIGAGGLGCEILKDLALSGVTDIHVIDLDTIDVTNLNRQFLFRKKDVGRGKAETAAEFINKRVPGCNVTPYNCKIQEKDQAFYKQFKVVISGLDNIEARRWLNGMLHAIVERCEDEDGDEYFDGIIPMIDGGTEGLKGQARVILPKCTACFECTMENIPPPLGFAMCTIAETPRIPEHCIAYAYLLEWPKVFPDKKVDKDSAQDMQWIYEHALERSKQFDIEGVTYFKTLGVVKTIIPAVASTNAIISAACVNEAIKMLSFSGQSLNCNFMIMGAEGFYTPTFEYDRKEDCMVCGSAAEARPLRCSTTSTLAELIQHMKEDNGLQLKKPSVTSGSMSLYLTAPPALEKATKANLDKTLTELGITTGSVLGVTDPVLFQPISVKLELV